MTFSPALLGCSLINGLRDIAARYDVLLCDVWGVIHDGNRAFAGANEALSRFRDNGATVVLLTNAPRPNGAVAAQIEALGVVRGAYDEIVTSGDATVALIEQRGTAAFYHIGPPRDFALFAEVERKTGSKPKLTRLEEASYAVCTGLFDDRTEGPDDYAQVFAALRARGLDMICANPDVVVHVGERLIFCGGALAERYEAMGGTVLYAGKPHPPIYQVALRAAETKRGGPVETSRVLAIGDALRTDIAGARGQNLASLFVTSGIHREDAQFRESREIDPAALAALLRSADQHPTAAISQLAW